MATGRLPGAPSVFLTGEARAGSFLLIPPPPPLSSFIREQGKLGGQLGFITRLLRATRKVWGRPVGRGGWWKVEVLNSTGDTSSTAGELKGAGSIRGLLCCFKTDADGCMLFLMSV